MGLPGVKGMRGQDGLPGIPGERGGPVSADFKQFSFFVILTVPV